MSVWTDGSLPSIRIQPGGEESGAQEILTWEQRRARPEKKFEPTDPRPSPSASESGASAGDHRQSQGGLLKKVLDSIKDLVNDANFDCSATGFSLQAMDSSHVALVSLLLRSEGFEHYRCDRNLSTGMNLGNMAKMLKCAGNDDIITIKADDGGDTVTFMFESPGEKTESQQSIEFVESNGELYISSSVLLYSRHCKWVDEVIPDAPWVINQEFLAKHNFD
ncbi:hypothetical protein CASFOL_022861 [Castilleja foliolosa]|uniref:Proliferating cell nuclear antigen PCNA N-terminal domain-containing protein n=1 Tax=Castilleja foliolosa TaxID=1961234 RepID=A0ABD3CW81_9LAMI